VSGIAPTRRRSTTAGYARADLRRRLGPARRQARRARRRRLHHDQWQGARALREAGRGDGGGRAPTPAATRQASSGEEVKVSYDHDLEYAKEACEYWAPLALSPEQKSDVEDPIELERLADENPWIAQRRFIVTNDPEECAERIGDYVALGFDPSGLPRARGRPAALPRAVRSGRRPAPARITQSIEGQASLAGLS
jgi:hypothetical protein